MQVMQPIHDEEALPANTLDTLDTPKDTVDPVKETTLDEDSTLGSAPSDLSATTTVATQAQGAEQVQSNEHPPVFEGDGEDPYHTPIPERTSMEWIAYTVSLNYNKLATSVLSPLTRWHWYDRVPNTPFILGAVPSEELLPQIIKEEGVTDIVNMCAEFKGHLEKMQELGLHQCWIPTQDFCTPSLESIWIGVRYIEKCKSREPQKEQVQEQAHAQEHEQREPAEDRLDSPKSGGLEGGTVYLHCKAGRGRSATVALCWLVYAYKVTRIEAQVILFKARGQVDKSVHSHPEVVAFEKQVLEQEQEGSIARQDWPTN
ncbi:hypothetical protein EMPS_00414 [Entomortierella parvispora]|uniref:Protein-tyrosine-phosphatase n=1 Tax=Entomortierella parvispora TaxID=205924 RepID=A0A9P3H1L7_9FUNG|nr:hypothetical protein EMPS_00414 [Entomortierella parvispora]